MTCPTHLPPFFTALIFLFFGSIALAQPEELVREHDYSDYIQSLIGGEREVSIDGGRIDLLTDEYAIEIKRAPKWKEAIGQSLWYALNTNKKPAIILILEDQYQYKYFVQLNSALSYANLDQTIHVMLFPHDFEDLIKE